MVLVFLRDWRSAGIVVVTIPFALLSAVIALWGAGQTINVMTLGGLALAVGILVDEATVAIENIHTHLARGVPVAEGVLDASGEVVIPRLLAMLSVVAVFVPSFFMTGVSRSLFVPLSLAVGFSMIASFFLAARGMPRRPLTMVYACWAAMCLQLVGYAVARSLWQVVVVTALGTALLVYGQILWSTLLQRLVPRHLLGRVASVDALLSWGLTPVSYALTAPVVHAFGLDATLVIAGLGAAVVLVGTYALFPRVRRVPGESSRFRPVSGTPLIAGNARGEAPRSQ